MNNDVRKIHYRKVLPAGKWAVMIVAECGQRFWYTLLENTFIPLEQVKTKQWLNDLHWVRSFCATTSPILINYGIQVGVVIISRAFNLYDRGSRLSCWVSHVDWDLSISIWSREFSPGTPAFLPLQIRLSR